MQESAGCGYFAYRCHITSRNCYPCAVQEFLIFCSSTGGDFTSPLIIVDGFDRPSFIDANDCKWGHLAKEIEKAT